MNFTFGIVTTNASSDNFNLSQLCYSIEQQNIPDDQYEVIIVGGNTPYNTPQLRILPFYEDSRPGWITAKKNLITQSAKYDNIVYMHDYLVLSENWYKGFEMFGNDFDVCMTPIKNLDGTRYRDWTIWPDDLTDVLGKWNSNYLLPYDITHLSKYMYISGAYWIAKKSIMKKFPLDENLSWGESEDVVWSKQIREHHQFSINTNSHVKLQKQKDRVFNDITPEMLTKLNK